MANNYNNFTNQDSRQLSHGAKTRWEWCKNMSGETIPAYAIMALDPDVAKYPAPTSRFQAIDVVDNSNIFRVTKPNSELITNYHPSMFCFNDKTPIQKDGYGRMTFVCPAIVRTEQTVDGSRSGSAPYFGTKCGPVANKWEVTRDGSGFLSIGNSMATQRNAKYNCDYLVRCDETVVSYGIFFHSSTSEIAYVSPIPFNLVALSAPNENAFGFTVDSDTHIVSPVTPGLYRFQFNGTLEAGDSSASLDILKLTAYYVNADGVATATSFAGSRKTVGFSNGYVSHTGAENVSFGGMMELGSGTGFKILNTGAATIITNGCLTVYRVSPLEAGFDYLGSGH